MANKIAFITGANRGLGFETARELAEQGVQVIIGSRDKGQGDKAANALTDKGFKAEAFQFDVDKVADHQKIYDYIEKTYGKLDILVNNAGVWLDFEPGKGDGKNHTSTTSPDIMRKTFDTNFFHLVELTQKLLPLIRKAPTGRIVNLSSILGSLTEHSNPKSFIYDFKVFAYNASKTALNAFTVHLAHELKDTKIKVNSAHPGWVKTAMGGSAAPMEVSEGGKTSAQLALLPEDGPTGSFIHVGQKIAW